MTLGLPRPPPIVEIEAGAKQAFVLLTPELAQDTFRREPSSWAQPLRWRVERQSFGHVELEGPVGVHVAVDERGLLDGSTLTLRVFLAKGPNSNNTTRTSQVRFEGADTVWLTFEVLGGTVDVPQKWVRAE